MFRHRRFTTLLFVSLLATSTARAALLDVEVLDRSQGDTLSVHTHRGERYVAGTPAHRYAIRLNNRSAGRVLVVLSVDGINAISGETAAFGQTGYVLEPYGSAEIVGWRKSLSETAAFYFAALPESYAARTGRPDNVGVIGAAVFRERIVPPPLAMQAPATRSAEAPAASADAMREKKAERLGTGHGEREYAPTQTTHFERASAQPAELVQIRYDSYANLVAAGVIRRSRSAPWQPQAFPAFVPDPVD